jgi:pimeloyl-ACP methyl ester carboxylesterase
MRSSRTIELGGARSLHAVTAGKGPDVVLVHGMLATSHDWLAGPFDRLVEAGYRVTAIDRPGHGLSRRPRFEGTPRDQARQIRKGLQELGIERPVLVGHSFGGLVCLAFAEQFGGDVAALILVAPVAFPELRLVEHSFAAPRAVPLFGPLASAAASAMLDLPMLKLIQRQMFAPQPVPRGWEESFPYQQQIHPAAMVFEGEDAAAIMPMSPTGTINIAAVRTPTQILTGTSDRIIEDERQGKLLSRLLADARLTEVEGVGHMLHHARPDLIVEAVQGAFAKRA